MMNIVPLIVLLRNFGADIGGEQGCEMCACVHARVAAFLKRRN